MNRLGDFLPTFHLRRRVDARRPDIALSLLRNLRGLGDDEARRGALAIIFDVKFVWRVGAVGRAVARERRHDGPVFQIDVAQAKRRKKDAGVLRSFQNLLAKDNPAETADRP